MKTRHSYIIFIILITIILSFTCGYEEEKYFLNPFDPDMPAILTINPANNSKIDGTVDIVITYSEAVTGADSAGNYAFSGAGAGTLSVNSATNTGANQYTLDVTGVPGDSSIVLTISNVQDAAGNALSGNTVNYNGWWNINWSNRRKLTFDNSARPENLQSFPVLVKLNSSRIDYSLTQNSGQDIRFVDANVPAQLSYEIEQWNEAGDSYVWVKIPQINSSSNTDYAWIYYGNTGAGDGQSAENVWDSNYICVLHLKETSGTLYDSTSNNRDGTPGGTLTSISGAVGRALDFDAGTDRISISANLGATVTISAWAKLDTQGDMLWCIDNDNLGPDLWFQGNNLYLNIWDGTANPFSPSAQPANVNQWHYYTTIISQAGNNTVMYIDGLNYATALYRNPTGTMIFIGSSDTNYTWDGSVDEFRVSGIVRSANWISADYASMNDTLITFGSEE